MPEIKKKNRKKKEGFNLNFTFKNRRIDAKPKIERQSSVSVVQQMHRASRKRKKEKEKGKRKRVMMMMMITSYNNYPYLYFPSSSENLY